MEPIMQHKRDIAGFVYLFYSSLLLILTANRADKAFAPRRLILPYPQSNGIRSDDVTVCFDDKFPRAARHFFYTPHNLCWHREPRRRSECTHREASAVKCVRTTCLFSKLQEDVVSREHHEQCSDWTKLLFTITQNTWCCYRCRGIHANTIRPEEFLLKLHEMVYNSQHLYSPQGDVLFSVVVLHLFCLNCKQGLWWWNREDWVRGRYVRDSERDHHGEMTVQIVDVKELVTIAVKYYVKYNISLWDVVELKYKVA